MNKRGWKTAFFFLITLSAIVASFLVYRNFQKQNETQTKVTLYDEMQANPFVPESPKKEEAFQKEETPKSESIKIAERPRVKEKRENKVPVQNSVPAAPAVEQKNTDTKEIPPPEDKKVTKAPPVPPLKPALPNTKTAFNWSAGLLAETNMNAPKGYAFGSGLYFLFMFPDTGKAGRFSAGIKGLYSTDFKRYRIADTVLLLRWNFYDFAKHKSDGGFFIQAEGGAAFGWNGENAASKPVVFGLGQAAIGYRYTLRSFFMEPYIYAGYPTLWGAGIAGGIRIGD